MNQWSENEKVAAEERIKNSSEPVDIPTDSSVKAKGFSQINAVCKDKDFLESAEEDPVSAFPLADLGSGWVSHQQSLIRELKEENQFLASLVSKLRAQLEEKRRAVAREDQTLEKALKGVVPQGEDPRIVLLRRESEVKILTRYRDGLRKENEFLNNRVQTLEQMLKEFENQHLGLTRKYDLYRHESQSEIAKLKDQLQKLKRLALEQGQRIQQITHTKGELEQKMTEALGCQQELQEKLKEAENSSTAERVQWLKQWSYYEKIIKIKDQDIEEITLAYEEKVRQAELLLQQMQMALKLEQEKR